MIERLQRRLLRLYGLLPRRARGALVRWGSPSFPVGALCLIERDDGRILLVRDVYRTGWGLPGGLLKRREHPSAAVRREVREEIGLELDLDPRPHVVVDPRIRRVDVVYRARPVSDDAAAGAASTSAEIDEVAWFAPDRLPELQRETLAALAELEVHPAPGRPAAGTGGPPPP